MHACSFCGVGVKKPKPKKIKKSEINTDITPRQYAKLPHRADISDYYSREIKHQLMPWCNQYFKPGTFRLAHSLNYIFFEHEHDLTMFLLRWAR